MKCLLRFTDIITLRASDVLGEEYNVSGCARASLLEYLGRYNVWQLYPCCPADSASSGHDLKVDLVRAASMYQS